MSRIDAPFAAISLLCILLLVALLWRPEHHGDLTAHCDKHRSLVYEQEGRAVRIVEYHPDCRP